MIVNQEDAKLIHEIFDLYLKGNSPCLGSSDYQRKKAYRSKTGYRKETAGSLEELKFGITHIQSNDHNVLYLGKVLLFNQIYDGQARKLLSVRKLSKKPKKGLKKIGLSVEL